MNADLGVLAGSGPQWFRRIKRMASNAPGLDIFTERYVLRDSYGWQITDAGRKALQLMDKPLAAPPVEVQAAAPPLAKPKAALVARGALTPALRPSAKVVIITERRRLPRRVG